MALSRSRMTVAVPVAGLDPALAQARDKLLRWQADAVLFVREGIGVEPEPVEEREAVVDPNAVTFRCEQWAGVRLHNTAIKFEGHLFTTSDLGEIAQLDAWEHAERVT